MNFQRPPNTLDVDTDHMHAQKCIRVLFQCLAGEGLSLAKYLDGYRKKSVRFFVMAKFKKS